MSRRWLTADEAAGLLPVSVNTVRRWVDRYIVWCAAQGVDPAAEDAPDPPDEPGYLRGWLTPQRRGPGVVRAVDRAYLEVVRRRFRLDNPTPGGHCA